MFELNTKPTGLHGMSSKQIFLKYLKYWYIFLLGVVVCVGAAFLYLRYIAVPQYRINSTVLVKDKDKGAGVKTEETLGDLGLVKPSSNIEDQIGILSSTNLMEKVLEALELGAEYRVKGKFKDIELYWKNLPFQVKVIGSERPKYGKSFVVTAVDSLTYRLANGDEAGTLQAGVYQFGDTIITPYHAFQVVKNLEYASIQLDKTPIHVRFANVEKKAMAYSQQLLVEPENKTGSLLSISLLDAIPQRGKDIARTLIEIYAEEAVKYQNQLAISTIEIIDERLKLLTGEITDVEKDIATYKRENDLTNVSSDAAVYLQRAQQANRQLEEYQTQIDILNSIESYLSRGDNTRLVPSSLNIQDPTLSGLIGQFNARQLERKNLVRTTPADNPLVVNIDRTLADLRADILENLRNIKDGLLIAQKNVRANSNRAQAQIAKVPSAERALLSINRDQGLKQDLYLYLLQKREEEALSLEAPISNTRIIDPPKAASWPESPNKTSTYLGALIFGLFLPFTFVYVKRLLNDKVEEIESIEAATNAPILGQIAHNDSASHLVVTENKTNAVAELFRLMRFNLSYLTSGRPNKVILITSGMEGEGKTFFTINLGASIALTGKKVVALSFDLRAPKLLRNMGLKESLGITDYLVDDKWTSADIIVKAKQVENLDIIGSGPIPQNAGELMLHPRIGGLLEELKATYDYVLIDSAPVGKVADAFALAPHIDATVYLVRQNYSGSRELQVLDDIFENQKLKHPMVVLNDTKTVANYGYGRGQQKAKS